MTSYLNLLKINDRSPFDTSFEGDVSISDDLIVSDDATIKDLLTVNRIKVQEIEAEDKVLISCNTSSTALEVRQTGLGDCLRIEDSTNPDSSRFVINSSGQVGIGIIPSFNKLEVNGSVTMTGIEKAISSVGDNYIPMEAYNVTGNAYNQFMRYRSISGTNAKAGIVFSNSDSLHTRLLQNGNNFIISSSSQSSTRPTDNSFTDLITINNSGNMGLGIVPTNKLDVNGNASISGTLSVNTRFIPPVVSSSTRNDMTSLINGTTVYDSDLDSLMIYNINAGGSSSWIPQGKATYKIDLT